jgi:hypothetical protein
MRNLVDIRICFPPAKRNASLRTGTTWWRRFGWTTRYWSSWHIGARYEKLRLFGQRACHLWGGRHRPSSVSIVDGGILAIVSMRSPRSFEALECGPISLSVSSTHRKAPFNGLVATIQRLG